MNRDLQSIFGSDDDAFAPYRHLLARRAARLIPAVERPFQIQESGASVPMRGSGIRGSDLVRLGQQQAHRSAARASAIGNAEGALRADALDARDKFNAERDQGRSAFLQALGDTVGSVTASQVTPLVRMFSDPSITSKWKRRTDEEKADDLFAQQIAGGGYAQR